MFILSFSAMTLLHQIPFNEMFSKLRYLISKLGHIMQISFNVFNFGTGAGAGADLGPTINNRLFYGFLKSDLNYLMLEGSWCPRQSETEARRCESPCSDPQRGAAYDWATFLQRRQLTIIN